MPGFWPEGGAAELGASMATAVDAQSRRKSDVERNMTATRNKNDCRD